MLVALTRPGARIFVLRAKWIWSIVPMLTLLAYAPSLLIGFLSDDFGLLKNASINGWTVSILPNANFQQFHRPLGDFLTWRLGWELWGFNPLPYHIISLLLHAFVALVLGLWVSVISKQQQAGIIVGSLFGIYPLHLEAVAWISSQWDLLAALFGGLSLLSFTLWWKHRTQTDRRIDPSDSVRPGLTIKGKLLFGISLLLYGAALLTKESVLLFFPVLIISAWCVSPRMQRRAWLSLLGAALPFIVLVCVTVALRFIAWGWIGGYGGLRTDYWNIASESLSRYLRVLLSPVNLSQLPATLGLGLLALSSCLLIAGAIIVFRRGAENSKLMVCGLVWILVTLMPVLNLGVDPDLQGSRFLYLPSMGYAILLGSSLYAVVAAAKRSAARHSQVLLKATFGGLTVAAIILCWVQLQPWLIATRQVNDISAKLHALSIKQEVSSTNPRTGEIWRVENVPDNYLGAYLLRNNLPNLQFIQDGPYVEMLIGDPRRTEKADVTITFSPESSFGYSNFGGYYELKTFTSNNVQLPKLPPFRHTK